MPRPARPKTRQREVTGTLDEHRVLAARRRQLINIEPPRRILVPGPRIARAGDDHQRPIHGGERLGGQTLLPLPRGRKQQECLRQRVGEAPRLFPLRRLHRRSGEQHRGIGSERLSADSDARFVELQSRHSLLDGPGRRRHERKVPDAVLPDLRLGGRVPGGLPRAVARRIPGPGRRTVGVSGSENGEAARRPEARERVEGPARAPRAVGKHDHRIRPGAVGIRDAQRHVAIARGIPQRDVGGLHDVQAALGELGGRRDRRRRSRRRRGLRRARQNEGEQYRSAAMQFSSSHGR